MEVGGGPWTVTGGSLRQLVSCTDRIGDFRCRMQENGGRLKFEGKRDDLMICPYESSMEGDSLNRYVTKRLRLGRRADLMIGPYGIVQTCVGDDHQIVPKGSAMAG